MISRDLPISRRMRIRWIHARYLVSEGRLNLQNISTRAVTYESLLLLELDSEVAAGPHAPTDEDTPEQLYDKLCRRVSARIEDTDPRSSRETRRAIERFRIGAALEPLVAVYETKPDPEIARTLLALGDLRGLDLLLERARARQPQSVEVLRALLQAGRPEALEPTFDWIEDPPPRGENYTYQLVQSIDLALDDARIAPHVDEERLLDALIASLDQRNAPSAVIPLLRARTGLDFGWYDTFQGLDAEERAEAQQETIERWRRWRQEDDR